MPALQLQRYESILARMIARVVARAGLTDLNDSSVVKHILAAAAREIDDANFQLTRLQDTFSIDRAKGQDLVERAKEIQPGTLTQLQAQKAIGYVVFSRGTNTGATITIPANTAVKTSGGQQFRTTQQGIITNTSAEQISGHGVGRDSTPVAAVAVLPGADGNVAINTVTSFVSRPVGVDSVTNVTSFTQGRDIEEDDAFVARIKEFVAGLSKSTADALRSATRGVTDASTGRAVVFVHVYEDPVARGNVTLYIDDGAGTAATYIDDAPNGTGDAITAPVSNTQTLTDSAANFQPNFIGRSITVAGATNPANNGTFPITNVVGTTQVLYTNAAGVVEASFPGTWSISGEIATAGLLGPPANSAVGGEEFLTLDRVPVRLESGFTLTSSLRGALVEGADYFLNPTSGLIYFTPALAATEVITAEYSYFTGLIAAVQKIVDGDPTDSINFPGVRAAGVMVRVLSPDIVQITVSAQLSLAQDADQATVFDDVESAITTYINGLGISGDVIRNEIIEKIMAVPGVTDVTLLTPAANLTILDSQLPRITAGDIDLV